MDTNTDEDKSIIGKVAHVYTDKHSISIELIDKVRVGDTILLGDGDTYMEHKIEKMKIAGIDVQKCFNGDIVEIDVATPVREGSPVYKTNI